MAGRHNTAKCTLNSVIAVFTCMLLEVVVMGSDCEPWSLKLKQDIVVLCVAGSKVMTGLYML